MPAEAAIESGGPETAGATELSLTTTFLDE